MWPVLQHNDLIQRYKLSHAGTEHDPSVHMQAFFLTDATELGHWSATHPEYTRQQHASLAGAVADFKGLKKKDKAAFLAQVEACIV